MRNIICPVWGRSAELVFSEMMRAREPIERRWKTVATSIQDKVGDDRGGEGSGYVSSMSEVFSYGFSCRNASTPELFDGSVRVDFPELTT